MSRAYYADSIANFLTSTANEILGVLSRGSAFAVEATQRDAWLGQIANLH